MRSAVSTALSAATIVAALGVSGCSHQQPRSESSPIPSSPLLSAPPADLGPVPPPEALSTVMSRLADPAVPGADKLPLVQDTSPADGAALDRFSTALRDTGFTPVTVSATDIRWSDSHPGDAVATIKLTSSNPDAPGEFAFPMEFRRSGDGWQLTRETADMLLAFGNARTGAPAAPATPR